MFSMSEYNKLLQIMDEDPEKKKLLSHLLESHQMMISTINHEIRNSLTLISSTLQLISSQHPETTGFAHWNHLQQDVAYTILLLEELSTYNNGAKLNLQSIDTRDFFQLCALSFAASAIDSSISFTSKIEPHLSKLLCDPIKLKQVLMNLLKNAKEAFDTSENSSHIIQPEISLKVTQEQSNIIFEISDNGPGIPEDHLETIFEPFVTYKSSGTGLGLCIASRIIRAHGGTLHVSSHPFHSTIFRVSLPIKQNC